MYVHIKHTYVPALKATPVPRWQMDIAMGRDQLQRNKGNYRGEGDGMAQSGHAGGEDATASERGAT